MRLRLQLAQRKLIDSNTAIGQIALECGFLIRPLYSCLSKTHWPRPFALSS